MHRPCANDPRLWLASAAPECTPHLRRGAPSDSKAVEPPEDELHPADSAPAFWCALG